MGSAGFWWRLLSGARSAQECPVPPRRKQSFCCSLGEWIPCYLGRCPFWWWQLPGGTSASQRAAGAPCGRAFCCRPSRWIRRHLGASRFGPWQRAVAAWDQSPVGHYLLVSNMFYVQPSISTYQGIWLSFFSGGVCWTLIFSKLGSCWKNSALRQCGVSRLRTAFDNFFVYLRNPWVNLPIKILGGLPDGSP